MRKKMVCEKCGNDQFLKGIQDGHGKIFSSRWSFGLGSKIIHTFCSNCGWIKESFVEKPHRFKKS